ncbi:MAG: orotate phosphoribosyltransferase [Saprospiraceae bacterium]|nr:orotate phosphoribosyltransferase [Saprospiraceae bacterium]
MKDFEKIIAQKLLQINAIKLSPQNPFTWASGIKSPIYCDNRITLSYPDIRNEIKAGFAALSESFSEFNHISGVATAGIAHGALLADYLNLPFSYVRSSAKKHGRQNKIEGEIKEGSKILVIEDLISTGGSSILAVDDLRENGYEVVGVMAIFTYEFQNAVDNFKNSNCSFKTLSNYSTLLKEAADANYISDEDVSALTDWSKDPKGWFDRQF